ncbi:DinB family protein [Longimicrobium sp.]|uniref:DinB family protein n=1 Tax=Longimicrobium sp. TaxID=2029185 RepID=UPI002B88248A|nr:DinB family protein [Longimicrobium sp.]HSU15840.1 DinB family protein [Longimicrobium sp.]
MHPRIQQVLDLIDEQYQALRAAADAVPAGHREHQPAGGGWSVAQVIEHVSKVENVMAERVTQALAEARAGGVGPETETAPLDTSGHFARVADRSQKRVAPERAHPAPDARYDSARAALDAAHQRAVQAFAAGDGVALAQVEMAHPALGPLNLYQWGVSAAAHEARHAAQIREIAATLASPDEPAAAS